MQKTEKTIGAKRGRRSVESRVGSPCLWVSSFLSSLSLESAGRGERTEKGRKEERGVLISFREKRAGEGEAGRDPFSFCPSLFLRLAAAKRGGGGGAGFGGGWGPKRPRNEIGEEENCYVSSSDARHDERRKRADRIPGMGVKSTSGEKGVGIIHYYGDSPFLRYIVILCLLVTCAA